jgi:hypothetical protein
MRRTYLKSGSGCRAVIPAKPGILLKTKKDSGPIPDNAGTRAGMTQKADITNLFGVEMG